MRRMPSRRRNAIDLLQLAPGDYVVHEHHGVGRYIEMVKRTVGGGEREYLIVEYAPTKRGQPGDRLFVPTDALDQITRYTGGEQPTLNRLGGADWAKTKGRARKAVKEIAAELIRLYSARTAVPGHAFGPDTPWQRELEDAFPYVETPDQLGAINEVKADMERPVPMDRIICGDVGYARPRSPSVRHSKPCRTAPRSPSSFRRLCWHSSTIRRSPSGSRNSRYR
jgi:transcription-repair coupling factor (superfamily II helicase)